MSVPGDDHNSDRPDLLYDSIAINAKNWFMCNQCDHIDTTEADIVHHLRDKHYDLWLAHLASDPRLKTVDSTPPQQQSSSSSKSLSTDSLAKRLRQFSAAAKELHKEIGAEVGVDRSGCQSVGTQGSSGGDESDAHNCATLNGYSRRVVAEDMADDEDTVEESVGANRDTDPIDCQSDSESVDRMDNQSMSESVDPMDSQSDSESADQLIAESRATIGSHRQTVSARTPQRLKRRKRSNDSLKTKNRGLLAGLPELKRKGYYGARVTADQQRWYVCLYDHSLCKHETKSPKEMARHINFKHMGSRSYQCSRADCDKVYASASRLQTHENNHRCGYSIINGDELTGRCGNENIYKYRVTVPKGTGCLFKCVFTGCRFKTKSSSSIRDHIHGQHVCPYRTGRASSSSLASDRTQRLSDESNDAMNGSEDDIRQEIIDAEEWPPRMASTTRSPNKRSAVRTNGQRLPSAVRSPATTTTTTTANNTHRVLNTKSSRGLTTSRAAVGRGQASQHRFQPSVNTNNRFLQQRYQSSLLRAIERSNAGPPKGKTVMRGSDGQVVEVHRIGDRNIYRHQKQSHRYDRNYSGLQSIKNLKHFIRMEVAVEGHREYHCAYNEFCQFKSKGTQGIARHIHCVHIKNRRFPCREPGCQAVYYDPNALRRHQVNHGCGFGMGNGRHMNTVCGNRSINRFRMRVIEEGKPYYRCAYMDCQFRTHNHMSIKEHIHGQHLCPNRVRVLVCDSQTGVPTGAVDMARVEEPVTTGAWSSSVRTPSGQSSPEYKPSESVVGAQTAPKLIQMYEPLPKTPPKSSRKRKGSDDVDYTRRPKHRHSTPVSVKLECTHEGCERLFHSECKLRQHLLDHRCGYGIEDGDAMDGPCGNAHLNTYWEAYVDSNTNDKKYRCTYSAGSCLFWAFRERPIRDHIHNRHVCPHHVRAATTSPQSAITVAEFGVSGDTAGGRDVSVGGGGYEDRDDVVEPLCGELVSEEAFAEVIDNAIPNVSRHRCPVNGCHKTFATYKALSLHRRCHAINGHKPVAQTSSGGLVDNQMVTPKCESNGNFIGLPELLRLNYYAVRVAANHQKSFTCRYNQSCKYKTFNSRVIAKHINFEHLKSQRYRCRRRGCQREYGTPGRLRTHEHYHRCGYSIVKDLMGVCGNENIYQYRNIVTTDGSTAYNCLFPDCEFVTNSSSSIKDHIHGQHVCPYKADSRNAPSECPPSDDDMNDDMNGVSDENSSHSPGGGRAVGPEVWHPSQQSSQMSVQTAPRGVLTGQPGSKRFKCTFNGCGKAFPYSSALVLHRRRHFPASAPKMTSISRPTAASKQIKQKYKKKSYAVERLTDRSINRHEKQDHRFDRNYVGLASVRNLKQYIQMSVTEGREGAVEKRYECRYPCANPCTFSANRTQAIARHLNIVHIRTRRFPCHVIGCPRIYLDPNALRQHELNHLCGFGILNGKAMPAHNPCSNQSINRFRKRVVIRDSQWYQCSFPECKFVTRSHTSIKRHIHNQHLCPHRVRIVEIGGEQPAPTTSSGMPTDMDDGVDDEYDSNSRGTGSEAPVGDDVDDMEDMEAPVDEDIVDEQQPELTISAGVSTPVQLVSEFVFENVANSGDTGAERQVVDDIDIIELSDDEDEEVVALGVDRDEPEGWVVPDYKARLLELGLTLTYSRRTLHESMRQLEQLVKIRPHLEVMVVDGRCDYACKLCPFKPQKLKYLSSHLINKHWIQC